MSVEYKDGTFGDTLPIDDAMKEFVNGIEQGTVKALHVGSYEEVEESKAKADFHRDIKKAMDELSKRLDDVENTEESIIKPATPEQIAKIIKEPK